MSVENLDEIIPVVDGLSNNKAAVFAYTEQAYQDNDVNGVSQYDFSKEQNIPDRNSTDTNAQVLTKGFRSQGASIPRNFLNHFIGRFSYNLNKMVDMFKSFLTSYKTDYRKNGFMYNATLQYQVGDVCMDVWTDHTFAFFIRTGNGGSAGVRPMVADGENWTTSEHWACLGSYAKTAQSFALRDKTGKIQVADPTDTLDAANKNYVDAKSTGDAGAVQQALNTHIAATTGVHGAKSGGDTIANSLIIRDVNGRAEIRTPVTEDEITNKSYVDNKTWDGSDITSGTIAAARIPGLDASKITSGALPIGRGGTGATTAAQARTNLGVTLANLGVTATATELNKLDGFTGSAAKLNFTNNVASDIQSQLNGKARSPGSPGEAEQITTSGNHVVRSGWYLVELWGGGGGGGSGSKGSSAAGGGGGGGGSYTAVFLYLESTSIAVTIGAGGAAGGLYSSGDPGGVTRILIGTLALIATGGAGGGAGGEGVGGVGGSGNAFGGKGGDDMESMGFDGTSARFSGGGGGTSGGGGGGGGGYTFGGEGGNGSITGVGGKGKNGGMGGGGGGGGGSSNGTPGIGGKGGSGVVILTPFF